MLKGWMRVLVGSALAAVVGAALIATFFFVMFGFDVHALAMGSSALASTLPAALLVGLPALLLARGWRARRTVVVLIGAAAGPIWALATQRASADPALYAGAAVLGGLSALLVSPVIAPRHRAVDRQQS